MVRRRSTGFEPAAVRYRRHMINSLTPDSFYESAREFAQDALQAHHQRKYRHVALHAGTALEHLAKACLAKRSPGLLTELRSGKFDSLLWLLEIPGAKPPAQLRTVGLREALERVKAWVTSDASRTDLDTMVGMRDGTVHAAQSDEVEERLLVAFVQQADALLADLGRSPLEFWQVQIEVVEALLADATDKVRHHVEVRAAAAVAAYNQQYGEGTPEGVLEAVQKFAAGAAI